MKDILFQPITLNGLIVKNRIYLPAMHLGMAHDFEVTDQIVDFYALRAKGGAGLICAGFATVDELSGNTQNIGAHDDRFIPGLQKLAAAIQAAGSTACLQINHAGRYNYSFFTNGKQPVAPSAVASRMTGETPKEMTAEEIHETVNAFASAAARAKKAGFDAVEVLSGTGYLISEFLSPLTNQRTDEYGGSFKNRMRFGIEVMEAVREAVGKQFPLIVRMNGNDFMPGGNSRQELKEYAVVMASGLADALCINVGWHEARVPQIVTCVPRGTFAYLARGIREKVSIPVIASHRINDPETARELIGNAMCDMVAMGRSLIADPMLPEKARQGRENEIVHCIGCAQGCFDNLFKLKHVECLCNPLAGYENRIRESRTAHPKKVMVIGGGAAGMTAALAAHDKGHSVSLYEKTGCLGGQLFLAAAPPGREEFAQFAGDLARQVRLRNIPVFLNQSVDEALVQAEKPDHIILATGSSPFIPELPGMDLPHVVSASDVLENKVVTGTRVAIIGGGAVGVETALFLSEKGTLSAAMVKFLLVNRAESFETLYEMATKGSKTILLIEMLDKIGKDIGKSTKWGMMQDLSRFGIKTLSKTKVIQIVPDGLEVEQDGQVQQIIADTIVVAAGSKSNTGLSAGIKKTGITCDIIGDAKKVATALDAVHSGYRAGIAIE
ncbi:MAG: NADH:flavin oxidoreductase [Desulfobacterales bacterium RIFOXYA12_FULL_46_15]|nr:MAG: NADH:flavin oxidoreductase [Desulfobacterales bacterium RIFOXYA12_FULL_46_15]